MIVAISGTPGTGKSFLARKLAKLFGFRNLDVNLLVRKEKLYDSYDRTRKCFVVDTDKLNKYVIDYSKAFKVSKKTELNLKKMICAFLDDPKQKVFPKNFAVTKTDCRNVVLVDSHLSHFLPKEKVSLCIITKADIKILNKRLKKRKYSKSKIQENIQAEIFDVCLLEAEEQNHDVVVYKSK